MGTEEGDDCVSVGDSWPSYEMQGDVLRIPTLKNFAMVLSALGVHCTITIGSVEIYCWWAIPLK